MAHQKSKKKQEVNLSLA